MAQQDHFDCLTLVVFSCWGSRHAASPQLSSKWHHGVVGGAGWSFGALGIGAPCLAACVRQRSWRGGGEGAWSVAGRGRGLGGEAAFKAHPRTQHNEEPKKRERG